MSALGREGLPTPRSGANWTPCVRLYLFRPCEADPSLDAERLAKEEHPEREPAPERPA